MSARETELALRKQRLRLRSAELRETLLRQCADAAVPVQRARQRWQRARALFAGFRDWARGHPQGTRVAGGLAAGGLLAGAWRQRRSMGKLLLRAVSAWQLWRRVSVLLQRR
ncbi:hypothetical protein [Caldimonas tepidiphila]|uniref:hypothetical protein n=1 Tax=Caldimonas tepidiphila TaxID=2315841 RepID=UPI000E5AB6EF|nr:hypothetical protein [Caldimonas tepidiphila]